MAKNKHLGGVIPALVTPMKESGAVDYSSLEKNVAYLSEQGVDGFFVNGTTSEGPILSRTEKRETVHVVREVSNGNQVVCAACIAPSANLVIEEIQDVTSVQPDYVVCVPPFYYPVSQRVIVDHYKLIARTTEIPIIFYDIPQHTHNGIEVATRNELVESCLGVGLKDSSGDFAAFSRSVLESNKEDFAWIQGIDQLNAWSLTIGASGVVSGLANVAPKLYVDLMGFAKRADMPGLIDCQRKINMLSEIVPASGGRVIAAIKAAVSYLGRGEPWLRHTALTATEDETVAVRRIVDKVQDLT